MKKTLVTGAAGFIGSHLVEALVQNGKDVKAFVHYNSLNHWGWLEQSPCRDSIEVLLGDVRDFDRVERAMRNCDEVYHLAALIGIPYSYESPQAYIRTNIEGTYNVLQSACMNECSNVLVTSTSETYGTAQFVPISESHPCVGQSPYSATKIAADQLAISYHRSFNLPVKIVRPFNTYGPRQSARAIIPTVISQILDGKKELKLGNLAPTRDLTFVQDTVAGFIAIAQAEELIGEATNIGMSSEISMGDLVYKIAALCGQEIALTQDEERVRPDKSEVERLFCDNRKILNATHWRPQYTLEDGLKKTIAWMKENLGRYKSDVYVR